MLAAPAVLPDEHFARNKLFALFSWPVENARSSFSGWISALFRFSHGSRFSAVPSAKPSTIARLRASVSCGEEGECSDKGHI